MKRWALITTAALIGALLLVATLGRSRQDPPAAPVVEPDAVAVLAPVNPPSVAEPVRVPPVVVVAEPVTEPEPEPEGPTLDEAIEELEATLDYFSGCPDVDTNPTLNRVLGAGHDLLDLAAREGAHEQLADQVAAVTHTIEKMGAQLCVGR